VGIFIMAAIEKDLWFTGRLVLALFEGDIEEIRSCPDPDAAEANLQTTDQVQTFQEDRAFGDGMELSTHSGK
jgi:hypothetical protein